MLLTPLIFILTISSLCALETDEQAAQKMLLDIDQKFGKLSNAAAIATWNHATNLTEENLKKELELGTKLAKMMKAIVKQVNQYDWQAFKNKSMKREFKKYSHLGLSALPIEKYNRLSTIVKRMETIYSKAKICSYKNQNVCNLSLDPEIQEILETSSDPEELKYVWDEWRRVSGRQVKQLFVEYVDLVNEAARLNNYSNNAEMWLSDYEDPDFPEEIYELWNTMRPLYVQLHAYVRKGLNAKYGDHVVPKNGPIPAHLVGNMWAQSWSNIFKHISPFPLQSSIDVSDEMKKQGYTPLKMFQVADEFFRSINLTGVPDLFWKNSLIEKPKDGRELICHASAWDFYDQKDFRIKQCTSVNKQDFFTIHHELGHIQYYLQYRYQPIIFRSGANPGFHEAVGDVISLSVATDKHLHKIGLLKSFVENKEATINNQMAIGLDKIMFLPFAYGLDLWRWNVFNGKIRPQNYNSAWWRVRVGYQGITNPTSRTEDDFDPGAKYHTVANVPYIRYFVSFITQFQFHKALCEKAGEYEAGNPEKPLHRCDIYQSTEAGNALGKMLQLGSSKHWRDALETLTGSRKMDAGALLEYFKPLQEWLERENSMKGTPVGWHGMVDRIVF